MEHDQHRPRRIANEIEGFERECASLSIAGGRCGTAPGAIGFRGGQVKNLYTLTVILVACTALGSTGCFGTALASATESPAAVARYSEPAYPLKASANNRYLVDQNNLPFLMVGDAPQTLMAKLTLYEAAMYMANRRNYGVNTLWINLLCNEIEGCKDTATSDGVTPFTVAQDLGTPNPSYFQHVDDILNLAARNGMAVLLDPIETGGWLPVLRANGAAKAFAYGQYLGHRYRNVPNIVWMHGNDFQSWRNPVDDDLVQAVARGIRSVDANHIHTAELNYLTSGTLDDPSWGPLIELDAAYTYFPTYGQVLTEYNRPNYGPVFLVEANYEFEHLSLTDGGSAQNLRRQEYWAMLSGATGQIYGSTFTWRFPKDWQQHLVSPGVQHLSYLKHLFSEYRWYDLVPDQTHTVVTTGYGRLEGYIGELSAHAGQLSGWAKQAFDAFRLRTGLGSLATNTYATAASTPDGSLVIIYMPTIRAITVKMSKLSGPTIARWYDPTNGRYVGVTGSPFANVGDKQFEPPGDNDAGDGDWVLVLKTSAGP